ncbi:MAG: amidohydrolase family protein, partial [Devosia sp.]
GAVQEARRNVVRGQHVEAIGLGQLHGADIAGVRAADDGITISEFPTTLAAARYARERGQQIVMGSPNVVLGGSHSGNVGAMQLAEADCLDVLTSDYVPASLLHGAFMVGQRLGDLTTGIRTVTSRPAELLGFKDRGRLEPGLRADIVQVRMVGDLPVVRGVWVAGQRVL